MQPQPSPTVRHASASLRSTLPLLGLLFAATGFAGLLSEQSYEKLLSSLLGASTPAAALVLAAYFGGLALGAALYGRFAARRRAPLRTYAHLELGVTGWSLLLALGASGLVGLFAPFLRLGLGSFEALQALRFLVACLWVVPPTVAMGATFPAVVDALEALRAPQPRRAMSRFYALNLAGAAAGALAGPYLVFPALGLRGTLLLCALIDTLAALAALWLVTRLRPRQAWAAARAQAPAVTESLPNPSAVAKASALPVLLFAVAGGSGFLSFGLEVVWTHLIAAVLGNSIYAFAAMLALVLLGLLAGSMAATRLFGDDRPLSAAIPGALLVAASLLLLLQRAHWPAVPGFFVAHGAEVDGFWAGERLRWLQAGLQLFPVCAVLGAVYPLLFRLDLFPAAGRAAAVARLSSLNSVGCVLGALVTGFFLIPRFGSEQTLFAFGTGALAFGALLVLASLRRGAALVRSKVLHLLPLAGALALVFAWAAQEPWDRLALTSGGHVYFSLLHVDETSVLKWFHEDTHGGITTVVEAPNDAGGVTRTLLTNGKFQANNSGETRAQTGIAQVPMLHVRDAGRALVIGLGSGASAGQIAAAGFKEIEIAEIAPGMVEATRDWFGHVNRDVMKDPRVHLDLEDGRNYLLLHSRPQDPKFDLISLEISSLWYAGSTALYSREFYRLAQSRLAPGGVLQQWVQLHHISIEEIGAVVYTLRDTFRHVAFWVVGGQGILVASDAPLQIQAQPIQALLGDADAEPQEEVDELFWTLASRMLSEEDVDKMLAARPFHLNTDANRWLEYATPRYNLVKRDLYTENLAALAQWSSFAAPPVEAHVRPLVKSLIDEATVEKRKEALGLE